MKFPIYSFSAKWSQLGKQDPKYPKNYEELEEGRIYNSTSFSKMFKEEQNDTQLNDFLNNWWEQYLNNKEKDERHPILEVKDLKLETKYKEHETFVCTWFSHETFDIGQTDEEFIYLLENIKKDFHQENK